MSGEFYVPLKVPISLLAFYLKSNAKDAADSLTADIASKFQPKRRRVGVGHCPLGVVEVDVVQIADDCRDRAENHVTAPSPSFLPPSPRQSEDSVSPPFETIVPMVVDQQGALECTNDLSTCRNQSADAAAARSAPAEPTRVDRPCSSSSVEIMNVTTVGGGISVKQEPRLCEPQFTGLPPEQHSSSAPTQHSQSTSVAIPRGSQFIAPNLPLDLSNAVTASSGHLNQTAPTQTRLGPPLNYLPQLSAASVVDPSHGHPAIGSGLAVRPQCQYGYVPHEIPANNFGPSSIFAGSRFPNNGRQSAAPSVPPGEMRMPLQQGLSSMPQYLPQQSRPPGQIASQLSVRQIAPQPVQLQAQLRVEIRNRDLAFFIQIPGLPHCPMGTKVVCLEYRPVPGVPLPQLLWQVENTCLAPLNFPINLGVTMANDHPFTGAPRYFGVSMMLPINGGIFIKAAYTTAH